MKKNIIQNIFIVFALIMMNSCKQEISLDISNSAPVLVVQGEVTTEKDSSYVNLTKSVSYYSNDPIPTVDNAIVSVNGIPFKSKGNGLYKADTPYTGVINGTYQLSVNYNGATYTSLPTTLDPLFEVDHIDSIYYPENIGGPGSGGRKSGYSVRFWWTDFRMPTKYSYLRYGKSNSEILQDSFYRNIILLDNSQTKLNTEISNEVGRRFQSGDTVIMNFKSCDKNMFYFFEAFRTQTSNAPGPFQVPAANLPTNIQGGAIGYFTASDVRRYKKAL